MKQNELALKEYKLQKEIEQLRHLIFIQKREELKEKLSKAEEELKSIQTELKALRKQNSNCGLILKTKIDNSSDTVTRSRGRTKGNIEIEVFIGMEYIPTAIYHLFEAESNPLVIYLIKAIDMDKKIKITSHIQGYSAKAINTIEIKANTAETIYQLPTLFPHIINSITEITKATLHIIIEEVGGELIQEDSYTVSLLSRNSAIRLFYNPKENELVDISEYLGVFVTPNQRDIISFLRTVADFHPSKQINSYSGEVKTEEEIEMEEAQVTKQIEAIFNAIKSIDVIYTNSVIDFNPHKNLYGQRVRLPREVLKERQANCLDGTFLYASLLEACSLNPAIVIIEGHAFIAWETYFESNKWRFLETTVTSSHNFYEACQIGEMTAKEYMEKGDLQLLPINYLRANGIMPME